jgi:magnesium-transporting ATPase (P-type)
MHVRTVMVTGDSAVTAATIASKIGIEGAVCTTDKLSEQKTVEHCSVIARVVPEEKYGLVQALQQGGHVVGMCGDGVNDAPALRQAQIGIAVSTATDVAKAAASMVLTDPGLGGIVDAVQEGRNWVLAASAAGIALAAVLALSGTMMEPLPWRVLAALFVAAIGFALILDRIKRSVMALSKVD